MFIECNVFINGIDLSISFVLLLSLWKEMNTCKSGVDKKRNGKYQIFVLGSHFMFAFIVKKGKKSKRIINFYFIKFTNHELKWMPLFFVAIDVIIAQVQLLFTSIVHSTEQRKKNFSHLISPDNWQPVDGAKLKTIRFALKYLKYQ